MQEFVWRHTYNGVFMVWVAGYLCDKDLVAFLSRARDQLRNSSKKTRNAKPSSFIYLLDNVRSVQWSRFTIKGQRVRSMQEIQALIEAAGLLTHKSKQFAMPGSFQPVKIWVLC